MAAKHPNVFCPSSSRIAEFSPSRTSTNLSLQQQGRSSTSQKARGKAQVRVSDVYEGDGNVLSKELGGCLVPKGQSCAIEWNNKIAPNVRIGNKGVAVGAEHAGKKVTSYENLRETCRKAGLGP